MIFSQTIATTILYNIEGLFRRYLNIHFIRKNIIDKIINKMRGEIYNFLSFLDKDETMGEHDTNKE